MKIIALILLASGIAVLADQILHRAALERIAGQADEIPGLAAEQILEAAPPPDCPVSGNQEVQAVAQALFTVEKTATSRTEYALEWTIAWLSGALGLSAPDLSYGPGQVRPSTLLKMSAMQDLQQAARDTIRQAAGEPLRLFNECHALALAGLMIRGKYTAPASGDALMERGQLEQIARDWNGQKETGNADALIAGLRYQRLVYELFQRLRFKRLRK